MTASRFDDVDDLAATPEPMPVDFHPTLVCYNHPDCRLVSYPREVGADSHSYSFKCPWKFCGFGV